ncbi:LutC/YkgG family protein [Alicyclobacillus fastidiosus]|nr:LUD domain-containing protein [Alicyclobacillus fastidiosus]
MAFTQFGIVFSDAKKYKIVLKTGRALQKFVSKNGRIDAKLPGLSGWTSSRSLPQVAKTTFREWVQNGLLEQLKKEQGENNMVDEKEGAFLSHIARRLGRSKPLIEAPQRKTVGVAGLVDMDSPQGKEELIEQFIINWNNLHGIAGTVYKSEIPGLIRKLVAEHSVQKAFGWNVTELSEYGVPEAVVSSGAEYTAWTEREDMIDLAEQCTLGITTCDFAIAETGTLALFASPEHGRVVSLFPWVYLALIPVERLVPRMTEVLSHATEHGMPSSLNFVTGPSRTGDIEMVLTVGVHGPGKVYAYIVE